MSDPRSLERITEEEGKKERQKQFCFLTDPEVTRTP